MYVLIEALPDPNDASGTGERLRWSFGRSENRESMRVGFVLSIGKNSASDSTSSSKQWRPLVVSAFGSTESTGFLSVDGGMLSLQLLSPTSLAQCAYRLIDAHTAVCTVAELSPSTPTVQEGFLFRVVK
jgi:hypothetical protein